MKNMNILFLDIETIKADNYIDFMPEELQNPPEFKAEEFNPDKVKRLKKDKTDEAYNARVEQARLAHDEKQTEKEIEQLNQYLDKREAWIGKCALSPLTGQVACVGINYETKTEVWGEYAEKNLLPDLCDLLAKADLIIGHNIKNFDLWFLLNRCRKYGIEFPRKLYNKYKGRIYWNENIIDTQDLWFSGATQIGDRRYVSLNNLAKYFGLGTKDNHISKNFEEIWNTDKERAIEHCKGDVILVKQIYDKLK